ncbi:DUF3299 domain-containing protein [Vibrio superstes]|uniref:DUF3299 domain-containing protein n=1 Tax=Vibrio superstes NBRC 103154 TaxID=1219062 RepID=A0A511QU66_9VIBR|nr:DUF3299 domain-containing protein [Vibrio superstes]GEM80346.1 hypothetical protein VSU01S_25910 [Vibrio superstes NBRC 103154]
MKPILILITVLFSSFCFSAQTLNWQDLVPKIEAPTQSVPELSQTELQLFQDILAYRLASERRTLSKEEQLGLSSRLEIAKEINLDVDRLTEIRQSYLSAKERAMSTTVSDLPIGEVTINGFLVPLQMDGMKTTQFLLVPTADACVHTPPPPINQIIVVDFKEGFELQSLDVPVSVSGTIHSKPSQLDVNFSDGNQAINSGYQISASDITTL